MVLVSKYLKVQPDNVPVDLQVLKMWTVWKSVDKKDGKKPSKVPHHNYYNEHTGKVEARLADLHNPNHLMNFENAINMLTAKGSKFDGIQLVLDFDKVNNENDNRLIGVDLDNVLTPNGDIKPEILDIIKMFNSYTEFSPSKAGIRIFCYGKFPLDASVHCGSFEIYQCDKLLTVTGERIITAPDSINAAQSAIDTFRNKYFKVSDNVDSSKLPLTDVTFTDEHLISKVKASVKGNLFEKLHYKGASDGDDLSNIAYSYCMCLVKYTQDESQIDRIYRESTIMREKWDRLDGRDKTGPMTWGLRTIRKCIQSRGMDVYTSNSETISLASIEEFNFDMYPYKVTPKGITKTVVSKYDNEETHDVVISSTPIVIVEIGEVLEYDKILLKLKVRNIKGKDHYVWRPAETLLNHKDVLTLQKEDLHIKESQINELIEYFDKFINMKKHELPSNSVASSCGWKSNMSAFVLGPSKITKEGVTEIYHLNSEISTLYGMNGDIKIWAEQAAKLLDYPAVRYKAYVSCVPPLIKIMYFTSYILFQDLPTGNAKTVSNWLAASMWGNPVEQQSGGNSTPMGIQNFIQYIKGLPSFLDETTQNPEIAKSLVYAVGNLTSRRKSTNDSTGGVVTAGTPETVLMMTGEVPIIDEKGRGGQDMRAQPLPEGVSDTIKNLNLISIGFRENYGHVSRLYIQKVIEYKNQIRSIYEGFLEGLPEVEGIQSNRMKEQYAMAVTAGFLLEKVFAEIRDENGDPYIKPAKHLEICTRYMEKNVVNKPFVADYVKALRCAYQFYVTNQVYFREEDLNHSEYGWLREEKGTKELLICFDEQTLAKYVDKDLGTGRYAAAVREWQEKGIINVRTINDKNKNGDDRTRIVRTMQIKVRKTNVTVLQIPLNKFYEHLHISPDESNIDPGNNNPDDSSNYNHTEIVVPEHVPEPKINVPAISANVPPSSGPGFNQVSSATACINENIIVPDNSTNLHDLIMNSLTEDDR